MFKVKNKKTTGEGRHCSRCFTLNVSWASVQNGMKKLYRNYYSNSPTWSLSISVALFRKRCKYIQS